MWLETVVKPLKEKLGKLMIWFDNCGRHKTTMVDDVIRELGVQIACLSPNMTGVLQVLDLIVNGPLKAHTKNLRGARIVDEEAAKDVQERTMPVFRPPKPNMLQGIQDLFDLIAGEFREEKFVEGVRRSFVSTGCVPLDDSDLSSPIFQTYSKHNICGTMKSVPTGTIEYSNNTYNDVTDIEVNETTDSIPEINFMIEYDNAMLEYDHEITEAIVVQIGGRSMEGRC